MFDGAELEKAIAANPDDVEAALLAYETDLFPRSASVAAEGAEGHLRALHCCIAYAARSRNHPAMFSGVTSCKAEANAA
jgi:hypothetical protein